MTDLKAATAATSLSSSGFVFGADSQSDSAPKIYTLAATATAVLGYGNMVAGTNTLDVRNGTNGQTVYIYNTYTSASVYERIRMGFISNTFYIMSETTGGTVRDIVIRAGTGKSLTFGGGNGGQMIVNSSGNFGPSAAGSTSMTTGFVCVPSASGTPTGAPTVTAGTVPLYYDSSTNKLWILSGGTWRSSAAFT